MKKIKRIWIENRVLFVLAIIIIICILIVGVVAFTYFYGSSSSVYGDRLDDVEDYPLTDSFLSSIESSLKSEETISDATVNLKGKIVYISISFMEATDIDKAKSVAEEALTLFSEEELNLYDIQFTITSLSTNDFVGYTLMGAKNATGNGVVWGNYILKSNEGEE